MITDTASFTGQSLLLLYVHAQEKSKETGRLSNLYLHHQEHDFQFQAVRQINYFFT
jgi:hypothetical protein